MLIHVQTLLTGLVAAGVGFLGLQFWTMSHAQTRAVESLEALKSAVELLRTDARRMVTREEISQYVSTLREADVELKHRMDRVEESYFERANGARR